MSVLLENLAMPWENISENNQEAGRYYCMICMNAVAIIP
jgi:hypothetical protein